MKINERLKTVGQFVPLSSVPLDIGCDHALLSIYLIKERQFSKVYASDNKEGPLAAATKNIKQYQVADRIELILASGLKAWRPSINTITISGMGGLAINHMLLEKKEVLQNIDTLILSPNNYVEAVRRNLVQFGYHITEECLVKDKNFFYPILVFRKGKKRYTRKDLFLGPILSQKTDDLTMEYYKRELMGRKQLLALLPKTYFQKTHAVKKEIRWLIKKLG